tara:strand:- start:282 stop:434 length:153 start_codon:yes stop_codon:yes gene_type:complete
MNSESFLFILAPLALFVLGVIFIPLLLKPKNKSLNDSYELINEFERKYIY